MLIAASDQAEEEEVVGAGQHQHQRRRDVGVIVVPGVYRLVHEQGAQPAHLNSSLRCYHGPQSRCIVGVRSS